MSAVSISNTVTEALVPEHVGVGPFPELGQELLLQELPLAVKLSSPAPLTWLHNNPT
jgi:hypothetical protein